VRRLAAIVLLLIGAVLWAAPAAAHAALQSTDPADRQVLGVAPATVTLTFNEPVTPIAVQVLDGSGRAVTREATSTDGMLQIPLPSGLADGSYLVSWRVTSLDSHPVAGSLVFAVGASPASWAATPAVDDAGWRTLFFLVRALLSATLLLTAGGALYLAFVRPAPTLNRLLTRLGWSAIAFSVLVVGVQGGLLKGGPYADILRWSTWQLGASTSRGLSAAVAILGLLAILLALRRSLRFLLPIGAAIAIGSIALTGHTGTASPRWLMAPLLAAHALLAGFWLGSLAPLLDAIDRRKEPRQAIVRFSRLALFAVPVLVFLGIVLARIQIDAWEALIGTRYGLLVIAKASLVTLLLGLAALNKWALTPRLPKSADRMASVIRAELAIGLAILAVTAFLSQTPPPATQHGHEHDSGHLHGIAVRMESGAHLAEIEIVPAVAGRNLIVVRLDLPTDPKEVTVELSQAAAGIEPIRRVMTYDNGTYVLDGPELAIAGTWRIRLDVLVTDFDKASFETEIPVR
jgi:copper transport protein